MKKITFLLSIIISLSLNAQNWTLDRAHSSVRFSIIHMVVSETEGSFRDFSATINSGKEDFSDLKVEFVIQAKSVDTDNSARDEHIRGADFFEVDKYPTFTFKSESFKQIKGNQYELTGDMTIKGITKKVTFQTKYNGIIEAKSGFKSGFKATTTIKRSDFNISWNKTLDKGGLALSDEVEVTVNIELNKKNQ
jgi:polyisoprenoid-binding protein YceI